MYLLDFSRTRQVREYSDNDNHCSLSKKFDNSGENNPNSEKYWRLDNLHPQKESPSRGFRGSVWWLFKISYDGEQYNFTQEYCGS